LATDADAFDLEKAVKGIIKRVKILFEILDEVGEDHDGMVVQNLGLEQVLEKAASLQNEQHLSEEEKARFLTAIVVQFNKLTARKKRLALLRSTSADFSRSELTP